MAVLHTESTAHWQAVMAWLSFGRPAWGGGGSRNAAPGPDMIVYNSHLSDQPYTLLQLFRIYIVIS